MIELSYLDVRPVLAKVADLERELVLVGGQAVNFWASYYAPRVRELADAAPFTSKDIDFCGDQRAVRTCAERLGGKARVATFDDATPNSGTVVFVDAAGVTRTLDVVSAPFGLDGEEVRTTALPVEILDDAGRSMGATFYVLCAREFLRDVLDGEMDAADPERAVMKLNERVFRFAMRDRDAKELYRSRGLDAAEALLADDRLPEAFRVKRWPQMQAELAVRERSGGG